MNLDNYITREILCGYVQSKGIDLQKGGVYNHHAWCIGGKLPISISEYEFNYLKDFIVKHNLKSGFELGTGIGISTITIGHALKKNDGKLITIDSYAEEREQFQLMDNNNKNNDVNYSGIKTVRELVKLFNLDNVSMAIGWSPGACKTILDKQDKIDFVFIDCPKCDIDFIRDTEYLPKYLAEKFAIFVHDSHTFTEAAFDYTEKLFGIRMRCILDFWTPTGMIHQNYPLAVITNL